MQPVADLVDRQFFAFQVLHDQFVVGFGGGFHQRDARLLRLLLQVGRNRRFLAFRAHVGLHFDQADDTFEGVSRTDGDLKRNDFLVAKRRAQAVHGVGEIGILAIHAVDKDDARFLEIAQAVVGQLGADLAAGDGIDHHEPCLSGKERADHFPHKVLVPWRVDQI